MSTDARAVSPFTDSLAIRAGSRMIYVCPLGDWQLDAGRHEVGIVVDRILLAHLLEHSTTPERLRQEAELRRQAERAAVEEPYRELDAALRNVAGQLAGEWVVRKLVEHHSPDFDWSGRPACRGCDQGCSCEAAAWPCSTVKIIARAWLPGSVWVDMLAD